MGEIWVVARINSSESTTGLVRRGTVMSGRTLVQVVLDKLLGAIERFRVEMVRFDAGHVSDGHSEWVTHPAKLLRTATSSTARTPSASSFSLNSRSASSTFSIRAES